MIRRLRGLDQAFCLAVQRRQEWLGERVVEIILHLSQRHSRAFRQRLGERESVIAKAFVRHHPINDAEPLAGR